LLLAGLSHNVVQYISLHHKWPKAVFEVVYSIL